MNATDMFTGKTAVITGASSGIGAGLAQRAAALGMKLVLADINIERLEPVADELSDGGAEVDSVFCDVTDRSSVHDLLERAYARFGVVDMLVNNAGIMAFGYTWTIPAERWDDMLRVNIGGYVNCLHSFVPHMLKQGVSGARGWIVNIASVGGFLPSPLMAPYSVTKFGVVALSESLHYELQMLAAPLQVSLVAPGHVKSEIFRAATPPPGTEDEVVQMQNWLQADADAHGLTPLEHATRVFDQVAQGRYWVVPQPEALDPNLQPRTDMILERRPPVLPFKVELAPLVGDPGGLGQIVVQRLPKPRI